YLDNIRIAGVENCALSGVISAPGQDPCVGDAVTLTFDGNAPSSAQYEWSVSGGTILGFAGGPSVEVRRGEAGTAWVSLRLVADGCVFQTQRPIHFRGTVAMFSIQPNPLCAGDTAEIRFTGAADPMTEYVWDFGLANVVSGQGAGPYRVVWNQNGDLPVKLVARVGDCQSQSVRFARVRKPDARFVVSSDRACVGDTLVVTYVGEVQNQQHFWHFGDGVVLSGAGAGPYRIVFGAPGGKSLAHLALIDSCAAQFGVGVNVSAYPNVSLDYDEPLRVFRLRDTLTLEALTDGQWTQWDFDGGTAVEDVSTPGKSAFRVVWTQAGDKRVRVVSGNDVCVSDTLDVTVVVAEWTGRRTLSDDELKIYPMPAVDALVLEYSPPTCAELTLFDGKGNRVVRRFLSAGETHRLEVENLPAGVYHLRLALCDGRRYERRVVVARR
ncbi:MAG: T9SS type A sorting domain-containing protein, partial [Bacteroidia bacterium]|nr:T9SS type A sorting domain-containing protein [Bacteroidia bacterium]